jgi:GNAT superfamily N-acetyltransferase
MPPIIRATAADAAEVATLIAAAFGPLATAAWLVPDPALRPGVMYRDFRIIVDHAVVHGEIHLTADRSAAAVWFPRIGPVPEPADYDRLLVAACGDATPRFRILDALFEQHHPDQPHHHLALLAVAADRQGAGLGTALLEHHHRRLDADDIPAYLEASSAGSRDLYARHGYQARAPFTLPDGTPFWPMWREPAPRSA